MTLRSLTALAAMLVAGAVSAAPAEAAARIKVGVLTCQVVGGVGFIVGSHRELACTYNPASGAKPEYYAGTIDRYGIDLGAVNFTGIAWGVLAPSAVKKGALAGAYVGASAEATIGVGVGANALIGGFGNSIVLNPISVQAQTGANVAAGIAGLRLVAR